MKEAYYTVQQMNEKLKETCIFSSSVTLLRRGCACLFSRLRFDVQENHKN